MNPSVFTVPLAKGTEVVAIEVVGLEHRGQVAYDDDRDGTPDRYVASAGLGAFEFTLVFDPTVVAVEKAEPGTDLEQKSDRRFQCFHRQDEPNRFDFGCASTGSGEGPQGTLTLADVTFKMVGAGNSQVRLEADLSGPLPPDVADVVVEEGGWIVVSGAPGAGSTAGPRGQTAASLTATPRGASPAGRGEATPGSQTPGSPQGTPGPGPTEEVRGPDGGTEDGPAGEGASSSGGASAGSVLVWTLAGAAGLAAAAGALGLGVLLWRRGH